MGKGTKILDDDCILAAWGDRASGPGWSNTPIWVLVSREGYPKLLCLQPEEQTVEMHALFAASAAANESMVAAVKSMLFHR